MQKAVCYVSKPLSPFLKNSKKQRIMTIDDCFVLGYLTKAHGLAGELQALFDVDDLSQYENLDTLWVERFGSLIPYKVEYVLPLMHKRNRVIVKLAGIDHIDQAETLAKSKLYLPLSMLPPLEGENAFYYHEVIGFQIIDEEKGALGNVDTIYDLESNALISMMYQGKEVLIPIQDAFILRVDRNQRCLHVRLPEGLLEVYLEDTRDEKADDGFFETDLL
jgi:16S rRNA processing protein RimM